MLPIVDKPTIQYILEEAVASGIGDKLGFLQATVEFALKREDLKDDFCKYLKTIVK